MTIWLPKSALIQPRTSLGKSDVSRPRIRASGPLSFGDSGPQAPTTELSSAFADGGQLRCSPKSVRNKEIMSLRILEFDLSIIVCLRIVVIEIMHKLMNTHRIFSKEFVDPCLILFLNRNDRR